MLSDKDALLIVDVQRDFLPSGALAVPDGDDVILVLAACGEVFAANDLPVFASRDWHPEDHCSFEAQGGSWPSHCVADSPGAEIDPGLRLPPGTRIVDKATTADKDVYSAFEGTELDSWLKESGVRRLFIGGLATEYCVLNTARDAVNNGYEVHLMTDAIRAIDPAEGDRAIESLRELHATIVDSGEILDEPH